jgi:hypothetical protein
MIFSRGSLRKKNIGEKFIVLEKRVDNTQREASTVQGRRRTCQCNELADYSDQRGPLTKNCTRRTLNKGQGRLAVGAPHTRRTSVQELDSHG